MLVLIFASAQLTALDVPELTGTVNDYANILSISQKNDLENLLRTAENKTSSQIVLLTITSLQDEILEEYSLKVAETWQLGQQKYDNGLLLLIALREKKIRIEVGYGLEGIITDAKSGYIIRNLIVPHFRQEDYYAGIKAGLTAITGLVTSEFVISDEELARYKSESGSQKGFQIPVGFIIFILILIFRGFGRRGRGGLLPFLILGGMSGGSRSSGSSGSSFGGFSGGGGSFGGGGASGGW